MKNQKPDFDLCESAMCLYPYLNSEKQVAMMLAMSTDEILEKYDFTDSIITTVKWADNLTDLILEVDYYWDIQEGRNETRQLSLIFKNCYKASFFIEKELPLDETQVNRDSCFTIVLLRENEESRNMNRCVEIFTTNYSTPWLTVHCSGIQLLES